MPSPPHYSDDASHTSDIEQLPSAANTLRRGSGFCGETDEVRIAYAGLHFGEEPVITAGKGSGTVFFTGCNLRCSFCQNYQISQCGMGSAVSQDEFIKICLALQSRGAANINLVTASHIVPRLKDYLTAAREAGVVVPYCWNSSAYESIETLELLKGLVTVWLPDLKTLSKSIAKSLFAASDYGAVATRSIKWMVYNNPLHFEGGGIDGDSIDGGGIDSDSIDGDYDCGGTDEDTPLPRRLTSGVIIRHLFLPGRFDQTADVLEWLHNNIADRAIISLMTQYTPVPRGGRAAQNVMEDRLVNKREYTDLLEICEAYNFKRLYYQDLSEDTKDGTLGNGDGWLPNFNNIDTFPNKLSVPVWHWKTGFIK